MTIAIAILGMAALGGLSWLSWLLWPFAAAHHLQAVSAVQVAAFGGLVTLIAAVIGRLAGTRQWLWPIKRAALGVPVGLVGALAVGPLPLA